MSRCFRRGLLACACAIGCVPDFDALRENRGIGGAGGTEPSAGSGGTSGAGNGGAAGTSDTAGVGGAAPGGSGGTESGECGLDAPGVAQFEFDTGLTGRIAGVWAPYPQGDPGLGDSTVDWSATEGHTCLGALRLDIPFAAWADRVSTTLNFQANWETPTTYSALHGWVRVAIPSDGGTFSYLHGVQLSVSSGPNYEAFLGSFVPAALFGDGEWHELIIPLTPVEPPPTVGAYIPSSVRQIAVQLIAAETPPAGGPDAPGDATLFLDDVWIEE